MAEFRKELRITPVPTDTEDSAGALASVGAPVHAPEADYSPSPDRAPGLEMPVLEPVSLETLASGPLAIPGLVPNAPRSQTQPESHRIPASVGVQAPRNRASAPVLPGTSSSEPSAHSESVLDSVSVHSPRGRCTDADSVTGSIKPEEEETEDEAFSFNHTLRELRRRIAEQIPHTAMVKPVSDAAKFSLPGEAFAVLPAPRCGSAFCHPW